MSDKPVHFINAKTSEIECTQCGEKLPLNLPKSVVDFQKFIDEFVSKHQDCNKQSDCIKLEKE